MKGELLYEGKAKKMLLDSWPSRRDWVEYKETADGFQRAKDGHFSGKGSINAEITTFLYKRLKDSGVNTHYLKSVSATEMICQATIIPLEVVTRNRLAGSTAKKLGKEEGTALEKPLVEFYYKDDSLGDPFLSDDQALMMKAVPIKRTWKA